MKILVLGVTGMLGSAVFKTLSQNPIHQVWGTLRSVNIRHHFNEEAFEYLLSDVDVLNHDSLVDVLVRVQPDVVINCIGLIKQLSNASNPLSILPINTLFPHRLANLCELINARLIHISTDCVFNGRKGLYKEEDTSDAEDLYGKSKYMGELHDLAHVITLRTSIIGHEINSKTSLVDWFLSQTGQVEGYQNSIFSGLPTVELAEVIQDFVIPDINLHGLYHVSVAPIDKYTLLCLIADIYGKKTKMVADEKIQIDRSLNSMRFRNATGYVPPSWPQLIKKMHNLHQGK